jgi:hypothetical protein
MMLLLIGRCSHQRDSYRSNDTDENKEFLHFSF